MFAEAANGNFLYHQETNGKFKQVAGSEPPAMTVKRAGWSWGGCFVDFDNDGFLDLYVMNGYYTAPKELSSGVDLESNLWRTMVRADESLSSGFRFSPEWKRTPAPDNFGPEIDARLAGVERQGDKILVHSLHGNERNRYFANCGGSSFVDISGLSGLDNPADGRGFAVIDYDRDGWQDVALVNANEPLFSLYHNDRELIFTFGCLLIFVMIHIAARDNHHGLPRASHNIRKCVPKPFQILIAMLAHAKRNETDVLFEHLQKRKLNFQ